MRVHLVCSIRLSNLAACGIAAGVSPLFAQAAAGEITGVVNFGTMTTAFDPRLVRLALKSVF